MIDYVGGAWRSPDRSLTRLGWLEDGYGAYTDDPFNAIAFREFFSPKAVEALNSGVAACWDIEKQLKKSYAIDTDFQPIFTPEGEKWYDFQRAGIEYGVDKCRQHVLLGDEPGLGKTNQAIGIVNELIFRNDKFKNTLVICTAACRTQWSVMIRDWGLCGDKQQMLTKGKEFFDPKVRWWITSYSLASYALCDKLKTLIRQKLISCVIFDEIHNMKEMRTRRHRKLISENNGVLRNVPKIIGLSGTPSVNRPKELYAIFDLMNINVLPEEARTKEIYDDRYSPSRKITREVNGQIITFQHHLDSELPEDAQRRMRVAFMIRREKHDTGLQLPSKLIRPFYLNESVASRRIVAKVNDLLELDVDVFRKAHGKKEDVIEFGDRLLDEVRKKQFNLNKKSEDEKNWATLRRELGIAKALPILDFLRVALEEDHKIVVIAYHREVGDILFNGLCEGGYNPVMVRGGVSNKARAERQKAFLHDENTRVFIGQMTAAGVGLNLQSARRLIIAEPSPVPGQNDQAMDRIHRIGQTQDVLIDIPMFANSLDELIFLIDAAKRVILDRVHNKKHVEQKKIKKNT